MQLIILPNQLFDWKYIKKVINYFKINEIIIYEHPQYFLKYDYTVNKLIFHRASMKAYYDEMKKNTNIKITYVDFDKKIKTSKCVIFDPIDKINLKILNVEHMIESPNFIMTKAQYELYREKTTKYFFTYFYMWCKSNMDKPIIPNIKSKDKENRQKATDVHIKAAEKLNNKTIVNNKSNSSKFIEEAKNYIKNKFKKTTNLNPFPYFITRNEVLNACKYFINTKLHHFGPYQDFIDKNNSNMYHSILSPYINVGLINPNELLDMIRIKLPKNVTASYEAYIRQLFWREYQRFCFIYLKKDIDNKIKSYKPVKLPDFWYGKKQSPIKILTETIKKAWDTSYLHHIERLMIIGNLMNLMKVNPKSAFRWFMEFSIDSYEWVMYQNVYEMALRILGKTTRKEYITSSAYILRMSNWKLSDDKLGWELWDKLYRKN